MIKSEQDFVRFPISGNDINFAKQIRAKRGAQYGNRYQENSTDMRWVGDLGEIVVNQALMKCNLDQTDWLFDGKKILIEQKYEVNELKAISYCV